MATNRARAQPEHISAVIARELERVGELRPAEASPPCVHCKKLCDEELMEVTQARSMPCRAWSTLPCLCRQKGRGATK